LECGELSRLLLDTHLLLWWLDESPQLPVEARQLIANPRNTIFVSAATIWEISIKQALGKLDLPPEFDEVLAASGFELLGIQAGHARATGKLPPLHRDPFDRMLLAQATVEKLEFLTADSQLAGYGPPVRVV
jgi:PIN domain nuclease of toxin-antitoxin system